MRVSKQFILTSQKSTRGQNQSLLPLHATLIILSTNYSQNYTGITAVHTNPLNLCPLVLSAGGGLVGGTATC